MSLDFELDVADCDWQEKIHSALAPLDGAAIRSDDAAENGRLLDRVWQALRETGVFATLVDAEHGGSRRRVLPMALALEQLGSFGLTANQAVLTAVAAAAIGISGSAELRQRILPAIADGACRFALAITESEAGFNILRAATAARRDGASYRLNGRKRYISGVDRADYMLLLARTTSIEECQEKKLPKTHGVSTFVVPTTVPGLQMRPLRAHGDGGLTAFELVLDDITVPAENLVGEPDTAALPLFAAFNAERILFAASGLGISEYCLRRACDHARTRRVFKDPIGAYQSIQHPLAEVKIRQEAVRLATYRAAWSYERGDDPITVSIHANSAKWLASELANQAVDAAIDTFGGKGFDEEFGIIHLWTQARLMKTSPISNALILNSIAEHVLGLPRSY